MVFCGERFGVDAFIPDERFIGPTRAWVTGTFGPAWAEALRKLGLETYQPEAWDCDKFADLCRSYAELLHARTPDRPIKDAALTVATFCYVIESTGGGHAIVAFFIPQGESFEVVYLEPQTGEEKKLTKQEEASCMALMF